MIKVERYKLFHNSKDFEIIFNKSKEDLSKEFNDKNFINDVVKPALEKQYCFLLYLNDKVIGYELVHIKNKKIEGGYTFILKEHRGKKYSPLLRKAMYEILKDKISGAKAFIRKSNEASIASAKKMAEELNLKLTEQEVRGKDLNVLGKIYTIE